MRDLIETFPPLTNGTLPLDVDHFFQNGFFENHRFSAGLTDDGATVDIVGNPLNHVRGCFISEPRGESPVKGTRVSTLLHGTENSFPDIEPAPALLFEERRDEIDIIRGIRMFVSEDQSGSAAELEVLDERMSVLFQHIDIDSDFMHINIFRPGCHSAHHGEEAAVAAHDLDDEKTACAVGGIFDLVNRLHDGVQRGIASDGVFHAGHVVVDRCGDADQGDAEDFKGVAMLMELGCQRERGPPAEDQQSVDPVFPLPR